MLNEKRNPIIFGNGESPLLKPTLNLFGDKKQEEEVEAEEESEDGDEEESEEAEE